MKFLNQISIFLIISSFSLLSLRAMEDQNSSFLKDYTGQTVDEKLVKNDVLSLKELAARSLLSLPLKLEEFKNKLPEELIEYLKQIISQDEKDLPSLTEQVKNGSRNSMRAIIVRYSSIFESLDLLTDYDEQESVKIIKNNAQIILNKLNSIIKSGTKQEIITNFLMLQRCAQEFLRYIKEGDIDQSNLLPEYQEFIEIVIESYKKGDFEITEEKVEEYCKLLANIQKFLNLLIKVETAIEEILCNKNISFDHKYKNKNALDWACYAQNKDLVELLEDAGAKSNSLDKALFEFMDAESFQQRSSAINFLLMAFIALSWEMKQVIKHPHQHPAYLIFFGLTSLIIYYNFLM